MGKVDSILINSLENLWITENIIHYTAQSFYAMELCNIVDYNLYMG